MPDHISLWGSLLLFRREFDQYVNLRPVRRQAVRQEIQELRQMRPALRKDRLTSDAGNFSPEEMGILRQVTGIPDGQ